MSKILDLAKTFKDTSSKEAESINKELRSDLEKLKSDIHTELSAGRQSLKGVIHQNNQALTEALADSSKELQSAIYKNQAKMSWSLFKTWVLAVFFLIILLSLLTLWGLYQGVVISRQYEEIAETKETLKVLEDKTYGITIKSCSMEDGSSKPCAALDTKYINSVWGSDKKNPLMILRTK